MDTIMDKKVDLHTHILPGIDDGSQDILESITIINQLYHNGVTDIVLTPHYIQNTNYNANHIIKERILSELRSHLGSNKVRLYLGSEVYLCENIIELLERHEISTINNTKYMLVELPLTGYLNNLQNILCDLTSYGIIPIIAHPERYAFLQDNKEEIEKLLEFNCLLQCNVESLTGKYGKKAERLMKWLLKQNLVQFIATDTHSFDEENKLKKSYQKLRRLIGNHKFEELTEINPRKVLNNEMVKGNFSYLRKEANQKW